MTDEPVYIEPSAKARWLFAAAVGFFLVWILVGEWILPSYLDISEDLSSRELKDVQDKLKVATGLMTLIALFVSIFWTGYFWRIGTWALVHSECPPPDTLVVKRTRVATGRRARIEGWASIILAIIPWVVVMFFAYMFMLSMEQY